MKQRDAPAMQLLENTPVKLDISNLAVFEIMFEDLTFMAQMRLCARFHTHPNMENWEVQPLAIAYRDMNES